jgi:hypothetical protein
VARKPILRHPTSLLWVHAAGAYLFQGVLRVFDALRCPVDEADAGEGGNRPFVSIPL